MPRVTRTWSIRWPVHLCGSNPLTVPVAAMRMGARFERVRQESSLYEFPVAFAALIHIEVSDQNRLSAVRMPADPLHDHAGALLPSLLSDVIEMRIQEVQGISGVSVLQLCPTANTRIFQLPPTLGLSGVSDNQKQPESSKMKRSFL